MQFHGDTNYSKYKEAAATLLGNRAIIKDRNGFSLNPNTFESKIAKNIPQAEKIIDRNEEEIEKSLKSGNSLELISNLATKEALNPETDKLMDLSWPVIEHLIDLQAKKNFKETKRRLDEISRRLGITYKHQK